MATQRERRGKSVAASCASCSGKTVRKSKITRSSSTRAITETPEAGRRNRRSSLRCRIPRAGDANQFRRQRLVRRRPAARQRKPIRNFHLRRSARPHRRQHRLQPSTKFFRAHLQLCHRHANHPLRGNFLPRRTQIRIQRHFQRRNGQFVHAQRAKQRMPPHPLHQFFFPRDDSRLRPAQQFISAEHHQRNSRLNAVPHRRLREAAARPDPPASRSPDPPPAAPQLRALKRHQLRQRRLLRKPGNFKIGGMHPQQHARVFVYRAFVIARRWSGWWSPLPAKSRRSAP